MHSPARILVVEDDSALRFVICEVLREDNLFVVEMTNADAALQYLKSTNHIDLIFTDVNMPGTMDGIELMKAVSEDFPEIKVVVTSGRPPPAPMGAIPFISKPYAVYSVLDKIRAAL